jgi:hypothetical protein
MTEFVPDPHVPYVIRSRSSALVLDIEGADESEGARVIQWPYHGGKNQRWRFKPAEGGYYRIISDLGRHLETTDDDLLVAGLRNDADHRHPQLFRLETSAAGTQVVGRNGMVLDVPDLSVVAGRQLQVFPDHGGKNQLFDLRPEVIQRLTLTKLVCISPSSGIPLGGTNWYGKTLVNLGSTAVGVGGTLMVAAGIGTGGVAVLVVGGVVLTVAVTAALVSAIDSWAGFPDQLYIKVNEQKIFPLAADYRAVERGEEVPLNLVLSRDWTANDTVQFFEKDTVTGDDELIPLMRVDPSKFASGTPFLVITGLPRQGSVYGLEFLFT